MQKIARAFLEIYGGKEREGDFENFKFHFCHRIAKLIKNRTLHDIMILVTTPQEHQVS